MNKLEKILKSKKLLQILQNDKDGSIHILKQRPELVKYTNKEFLDSDFIRKVAVENTVNFNFNILNFLPDELITKKLLLCCLSSKLYVETIPNILKKFSDDKSFIALMLSIDGRVLQYMPLEIKNNFDFLYEIAIKDSDNAFKMLKYASESIVRSKKFTSKFKNIHNDVLNRIDKKIDILKLLKKSDESFDAHIFLSKVLLSSKTLEDEEIALNALGILPFAMFPESIQKNIKLIKKVVQNNPQKADMIPLDILIKLDVADIVIDCIDKIKTKCTLITKDLYDKEQLEELFLEPKEVTLL